MFTQNYIEYRRQHFSGIGSANFTVASGEISTRTISSIYGDIGYCMRYPRCRAIVGSNNYCGVYFGSGTTPPQRSDYTLEAPIESGLSFTYSGGVAFSDDGGGKWSVLTNYIVTNTSDTDISISEIGVITIFGANNAQTTSAPILFERTVLSTPVTIAPGASKLITYKVTFDQPQ